jgi:hypothetical protein
VDAFVDPRFSADVSSKYRGWSIDRPKQKKAPAHAETLTVRTELQLRLRH